MNIYAKGWIDVIKKAFYKTIPVMAGYIVLGSGFGILLHNAGYGMIWAFAMSALIYAGSMLLITVLLTILRGKESVEK